MFFRQIVRNFCESSFELFIILLPYKNRAPNVLPITRGRATPSFAQRRAAQPFRRVDWPVGRRAAAPAQMAERPECSESLLPVKKWSELKAMNK